MVERQADGLAGVRRWSWPVGAPGGRDVFLWGRGARPFGVRQRQRDALVRVTGEKVECVGGASSAPAPAAAAPKKAQVQGTLPFARSEAKPVATGDASRGAAAHAATGAPNNRFQMDGVSTNWGVVTFAHLQNLKDGGVLGDDVDVCRNPVGDTCQSARAARLAIRRLFVLLGIYKFRFRTLAPNFPA